MVLFGFYEVCVSNYTYMYKPYEHLLIKEKNAWCQSLALFSKSQEQVWQGVYQDKMYGKSLDQGNVTIKN